MYKLGTTDNLTNQPICIWRLNDTASIPLDPANVDFANFKKEILADKAQLQDAEGVIMADAEAKAYVATLP